MNRLTCGLILTLGCLTACSAAPPVPPPPPLAPPPAMKAAPVSRDLPIAVAPNPGEKHFSSLIQLTDGGENAEAYFSPDGQRLTFQSTRDGIPCDQIFTMDLQGKNLTRISSGEGRTTCSYYTQDGGSILYASTHLAGKECPPRPDMKYGYTWPLYATFDIFLKKLSDGHLTRLTDAPGYDAEATVSPDGKTIIFTSVREGDIDLYAMNIDGTGVRRLTTLPGYDGGAFFSHDGRKIVWRASRPEGQALDEFRNLLSQELVRPSKMEIFVANADGTEARQITRNGAANFAPFFLPDDSGVIFASNLGDPAGRNFDLYIQSLEGGEPRQVTFNETFDGFPMFSPDGRYLVFGSNRNARVRGETNIFLAEWKP